MAVEFGPSVMRSNSRLAEFGAWPCSLLNTVSIADKQRLQMANKDLEASAQVGGLVVSFEAAWFESRPNGKIC